MVETSSPSPMDTLTGLVRVYDQPTNRIAGEALLRVAELVRLMNARDPNSGTMMMEGCGTLVKELLDRLRSPIAAKIGPLIGAHIKAERTAAEARIALHQNRINIIDNTRDTKQAFELLVATGWGSILSCEAWAADTWEQSQSRQAEVYFIGQIEYEIIKMDALFKRFVTKEGVLGPES